MKTLQLKALGLMLCLMFSASFNLSAQSFKEHVGDIPDYLPGVILFRSSNNLDLRLVANQPTDFKAVANKYGLNEIRRPFIAEQNPLLRNTYRLTFDEKEKNQEILQELEQLSNFAFAELYPAYKIAVNSNDPRSGEQYALNLTQASLAWEITEGNKEIGIAIVDNAVHSYHPDLRDNISLNPMETYNGLDDDLNGYIDDVRGYDVAWEDTNTAGDFNFFGTFNHGTHCAGISSASTNNEIGISSIGNKSGIIPIKAADGSWFGLAISHAIEGVSYAASLSNVNIISMSWGSSLPNSTLQLVISSAYLQNKVLIAAAGNDTSNAPHYPAAFTEVISVAATDSGDKLAAFSNYGTTIDLAAPGISILSSVQYSTFDSENTPDYLYYDGTSMSAPMVAGLAALVLDQNPMLTPALVKLLLQQGCDNIDSTNPGFVGQIGAGRINAYKTLSNGTSSLNLLEEAKNKLVLYPNPVENLVYVQLAEDTEKTLIVYSAQGQVQFRKTLNQSGYMDLSELSAGIYWIKVENSQHKGSSFLKL